ncbi:hypothetical protein M885DRAFT_517687 [Pelagophyceae sp. CCMP2097]|nr:hypothetical protein M885DRAFT_517687 [Pelagophyceae sp. CCMP2097]
MRARADREAGESPRDARPERRTTFPAPRDTTGALQGPAGSPSPHRLEWTPCGRPWRL